RRNVYVAVSKDLLDRGQRHAVLQEPRRALSPEIVEVQVDAVELLAARRSETVPAVALRLDVPREQPRVVPRVRVELNALTDGVAEDVRVRPEDLAGRIRSPHAEYGFQPRRDGNLPELLRFRLQRAQVDLVEVEADVAPLK